MTAARGLSGQRSGTVVRALRSGEEPYRRFVETTHEGICILDEQSRIVFANSRLSEMLGYAQDELIGRDGLSLMHEPSAALTFPASLPAVGAGHEVALVHKSGSTIWASVRGTPMVDEAGHPSGVLTMFSDITERRVSEDLLRRSEARFRALVENASDVVAILDSKGRVLYESPAMRTLVGGRQRGYPTTEPFAEIHPEDLPQLAADFTALAEGRATSLSLAGRFKHADGTWHYAEGVATSLLSDPAVGGIVINFRDVTERTLAEQQAHDAAERIERLTADAVYSVDKSGRIRSWNNGAEQVFGWTKAEAIGEVLPLVPESLRPKATKDIRGIIEHGNTISKETERLTKDGRPISVLGSWSPIPLDAGETGVLCLLKDISPYKEVHAQLEDQAKSLALLRDRERIAMDLHDGVIQSLYGVALRLGALRRRERPRKAGQTADTDSVLGQVISQLTETIQGIRDYIYDLRAGVPESADLKEGLATLALEVGKAGVRPRLHVEADVPRVAPEVVSHLLYVAHEALSNIVRHAKASNVDIMLLALEHDGVVLTIADNGKGFDPDRRGRRLGDGINNIRQRARLIGARLTIESQLGSGTIVSVRVP